MEVTITPHTLSFTSHPPPSERYAVPSAADAPPRTWCRGSSKESPVHRLAEYRTSAEPRCAARRYWLTRGMS